MKIKRITQRWRSLQRRVAGWSVASAIGVIVATAAAAGTALSLQGSITVEGNRRVEADTVRSYFHAAPDGRFDEAARDAALKALVATGLFERVLIERAGARLVVHVTEAPVLDRVAFEGNKKVNDADLATAIESKPRGSLQRATVQADSAHILEAYRHVGRNDVRVTPEIIDRGNGRVDLIYGITEGVKTPVRQIKFTGNHAFGERQLNAVIKTSATNMLSFLTGADVYDPDRIAQDQEQLRLFYRSRGYADASVPSARAVYDLTAKGFAVTFAIEEGPRYHFGDVTVVCNVPGLDPERLRGLPLAHNGAVFDGNALDKSSEVIAIELAKLGYPFAQATPRVTRDAAAQRVDVAFVIDQGPRTYVERIEIHGNARTRDYVIRREFDVAEGDPYNKTLIDRAERRLKGLNYFKTVKISNRPGSAPDRVVLDVEAVDESTGDFNIAGGYSTTDGALVQVKAGDRNVYGTGNNVQASVSYGQYARGIDLTASEPYFLGTRVSAGIELFGRQTDVTSYQSYNSTSYGGTLQVGTPITEQLGVQWRYSLYNQDISLGATSSGSPPSLAIQQAAANGPAWVSSIGSTATYSTLDDAKNPTSGVKSQLSQDLAGLGGDVKFLRTTEDVRYYQSLGSDLVGMVRAQGGYITGWGGQQVPLMNSFFGGPTMVRGFATNGFGPRDLTPGTTMDNVGGSMYWATTAELQSAIPGVPNEYGLRASAFVDAGSVFGYSGANAVGGTALQVANKNVVRSSVGVGLTWASPFGSLTASYAVPITKAAYDVVQPFGFTAGGF
ncbi:outer membrane protein assembly factor BamA [Bradyrhizobium genosp. P]|uniref:outer membrane protein assembly factor BamA n=1 Tax=Bradyrhizobium genosp. P TaxID=83641 RepID=UPI003CECD949